MIASPLLVLDNPSKGWEKNIHIIAKQIVTNHQPKLTIPTKENFVGDITKVVAVCPEYVYGGFPVDVPKTGCDSK